jgi:hypothetical protein
MNTVALKHLVSLQAHARPSVQAGLHLRVLQQIERDREGCTKKCVIKRSSWERSDSQSFFFLALPKWCVEV